MSEIPLGRPEEPMPHHVKTNEELSDQVGRIAAKLGERASQVNFEREGEYLDVRERGDARHSVTNSPDESTIHVKRVTADIGDSGRHRGLHLLGGHSHTLTESEGKEARDVGIVVSPLEVSGELTKTKDGEKDEIIELDRKQSIHAAAKILSRLRSESSKSRRRAREAVDKDLEDIFKG